MIEGWAFDPARPETVLTVIVLDNGAEIARLVADRYRDDLKAAGMGDGRHAFSCALPGALAEGVRHRLDFYFATDWAPLEGAPIVLESIRIPVAA